MSFRQCRLVDRVPPVRVFRQDRRRRHKKVARNGLIAYTGIETVHDQGRTITIRHDDQEIKIVYRSARITNGRAEQQNAQRGDLFDNLRHHTPQPAFNSVAGCIHGFNLPTKLPDCKVDDCFSLNSHYRQTRVCKGWSLGSCFRRGMGRGLGHSTKVGRTVLGEPLCMRMKLAKLFYWRDGFHPVRSAARTIDA